MTCGPPSTCCCTPSLEPIVEMVLVRNGDAIEAHAIDGRVRFDRDGIVLETKRAQSARRSGHGPVCQPPERTELVAADTGGQQLPVRLRTGGPGVRPSGRAGPVRDPHRGAQLGRPRRPCRRARLARRGAVTGAVHHRRCRCEGWRPVAAGVQARRRRADGGRTLGRCARTHRRNGARGGDRCGCGGASPRDRLPLGRLQPQRALRPRPTGATPPTWRGSWRWVRRSLMARWRHCPLSRSPITRRFSRACIPDTTASSTTRGSTVRPVSR